MPRFRIVLLACVLTGAHGEAMGQAAPAPAAQAPAAPAPAAPPKAAIFPASVSAKYASESAGRGRMHTCRDQYRANKATNGNAGMSWIQKGGGYYSACLKKLKG